MQVKFTITKEIKTQLQGISKQLPPLPVQVQKYKESYGSELIKAGHSFKTQQGTPVIIEPDKKYKTPDGYTTKDISHIENLIKFYKQAGIIGCHEYILSMIEHEQKARRLLPELFEDSGKGKYLGIKKIENEPAQ